MRLASASDILARVLKLFLLGDMIANLVCFVSCTKTCARSLLCVQSKDAALVGVRGELL